jgi:hypothetical protein
MEKSIIDTFLHNLKTDDERREFIRLLKEDGGVVKQLEQLSEMNKRTVKGIIDITTKKLENLMDVEVEWQQIKLGEG